MFPSEGSDETEDSGLIYLMHEYFHTFQTSHFFFFEDRNQFGINKNNFETGKKLPFFTYMDGEGSADFASLPLMAKQNLISIVSKGNSILKSSRASLDADPTISLKILKLRILELEMNIMPMEEVLWHLCIYGI